MVMLLFVTIACTHNNLFNPIVMTLYTCKIRVSLYLGLMTWDVYFVLCDVGGV